MEAVRAAARGMVERRAGRPGLGGQLDLFDVGWLARYSATPGRKTAELRSRRDELALLIDETPAMTRPTREHLDALHEHIRKQTVTGVPDTAQSTPASHDREDRRTQPDQHHPDVPDPHHARPHPRQQPPKRTRRFVHCPAWCPGGTRTCAVPPADL
jgi:hypothetical protein